MTTATADPFAKFKAAQREAWSVFAPVEIATTIPAAKLVKFAQIASGQKVLDLACGTGVVAVTAALRGAQVCGPRSVPGAARTRAPQRRDCRRRHRFHRGRRRGFALSGRFVRRRPQPVRPHLHAASGRGGQGNAARAQARRSHRVLDLAARFLPGRVYSASSRARCRGRRAPSRRRRRRNGAIPTSSASGSAQP